MKTGEILSPRILFSFFKSIIMKKIDFKAIAQELSKAEMKQIKGGYGGVASPLCGLPFFKCPDGEHSSCPLGCFCSSLDWQCA